MGGKKHKSQNMPTNYSNVADYFIAVSNESGDSITNLKLQKLVYYAQAWYLANFKNALFGEDFQAWVHGPVIPDLYEAFKEFGATPIKKDIKLENVEKKFNEETLAYLNEVAKVYMPCGAYQLEMMTHKEDPWVKARGGCAPDEKCTNIIDKGDMQKYYAQKIND